MGVFVLGSIGYRSWSKNYLQTCTVMEMKEETDRAGLHRRPGCKH